MDTFWQLLKYPKFIFFHLRRLMHKYLAIYIEQLRSMYICEEYVEDIPKNISCHSPAQPHLNLNSSWEWQSNCLDHPPPNETFTTDNLESTQPYFNPSPTKFGSYLKKKNIQDPGKLIILTWPKQPNINFDLTPIGGKRKFGSIFFIFKIMPNLGKLIILTWPTQNKFC
jgi:hypothetical protein